MCKTLFILVSTTFLAGFHLYGFIPIDLFGFYAAALIVRGSWGQGKFDLYLIFLSLVSILATFLRSSGNDLWQCGRILITILDGYGVYKFYQYDIIGRRLKVSVILLNATIPYIICGAVVLIFPDYSKFLILSHPKAVVSTYPLLVLLNIVAFGLRRTLILASLIVCGLGLFYESRSIMAGTGLFLLYHFTKISYKSAISILGSVFFVLFLLLKLFYDEVVYSENTSNTFRVVMSFSIFEFGIDKIIFGIGGNEWQETVASILSWKDNSEDFFSNKANPHFLPSELVIYGGGITLAAYTRQWHRILRQSSLGPELIACLVSSIFTTNTGVERMFLAMAFFVAIGTKVVERESSTNLEEKCQI